MHPSRNIGFSLCENEDEKEWVSPLPLVTRALLHLHILENCKLGACTLIHVQITADF